MLKIYFRNYLTILIFLLLVFSCRSENEIPSILPDTEKPTVPQNLSVSNITKNSFSLNWSASTDKVGVSGYIVSVNDATFSTTDTNLEVKDLNAASAYLIHVKAKDAAGNISEASSSINVVTLTGAVDIYVSGYSQYWKNGEEHQLEIFSGFKNYGNGIFVSDTDVYNSGYITTGYNNTYRQTAAYWKNGKITLLEPITIDKSVVEDIAVKGNNVYATGSVTYNIDYYKYYKCYWKNGVKTILENSSNTFNTYAYPSKMKIENQDVYITSMIYNKTYKPVYWKNGSIHNLPFSLPISSVSVNCIDVENGNVYVGALGSKVDGSRTGFYWKNGVVTEVIGCSGIFTIDVVGSDIYVGGSTSDYKLAYWKNGNKTEIPFGGSFDAIKVIENDVYSLVSSTTENTQIQKLFKNGVEILSLNNTSYGNLFVNQL